MTGRSILLRLVLAGTSATSVLAVSVTGPVEANDPTPCGYAVVRVPTSTTKVTVVHECSWPDCVGGNGPKVYQPSSGGGGVQAEAYACISNV